MAELKAGNPTATNSYDNTNDDQQDEDHHNRIASYELKNRIEPRQHRSENGGDIGKQSGKSTNGRRRQHSPFIKKSAQNLW